MLVFAHEEHRVVEATPQAIFSLIGDPRRHVELAGSNEVKAVHPLGDGPLKVGSTFGADEAIRFGRATQKFTAVSTIQVYEPDRAISWTSMPPQRPHPRRIQWWYLLEATEGGTRVTERVEVDLGLVVNLLMRLPYAKLRAPVVRAGMARTLENIEQALKPLDALAQ